MVFCNACTLGPALRHQALQREVDERLERTLVEVQVDDERLQLDRAQAKLRGLEERCQEAEARLSTTEAELLRVKHHLKDVFYHKYAAKWTVSESLSQGHTIFLRADWLVQQWRRGGRLERRQEIERDHAWAVVSELAPEDIWAMRLDDMGAVNVKDEGRYLMIALSYRWLSREHPDADGKQLELLARLLENVQHTLKKHGKEAIVFIDYCSLYQKSRRTSEADWTVAERTSFRAGLESVSVWYAHQLVQVWALTDTASGSGKTYGERGWTTFEWQVSLLSSCFVFAFCKVGGADLFQEFGDWVFLGGLAKVRARSLPPLLPEDFAKLIASRHFTCKEDQGFLQQKYAVAFHEVLGSAEHLLYSGSRWEEQEVDRFVTKVLPHCRLLRRLDLDGNLGVTDPAVAQLAASCASNLRSLNLAKCHNITDASVVQLAASCSELQVLNLTRCAQVTDTSVVQLAAGCPGLQVLHLGGCAQVSDTAVEALAAGCPRLHTLFLTECVRVTDAAVASLAACCLQLQALNLGGCARVTDVAVVKLAVGCQGLQTLALRGCTEVTGAAIEQLALSCPGLQTVLLHECSRVTGVSVELLAAGCPGLQTLVLQGCMQVTDAAVERLAACCPGLQVLGLGRCGEVTGAAVERLAAGCPGLQLLNLSGCAQVTDAAVERLAACCPSLQQLGLRGCRQVTDASVARLAAGCPGMKLLVLGGCPHVTEGCLARLAAERPGLRIKR